MEGPLTVSIRSAKPADLVEVGVLAGKLVRMHHDADPARFLQIDRVEEGYTRFLGRELQRPEKAVVLVAEQDGDIVGYSYGTLEGRDWNMLLDTHGAVHDIFIAEGARARGAGEKLVRATIDALEKRGAQRIILSTMVANEAAQRLFARCGFRPTMLEMTR